jgi:hypothetical protein
VAVWLHSGPARFLNHVSERTQHYRQLDGTKGRRPDAGSSVRETMNVLTIAASTEYSGFADPVIDLRSPALSQFSTSHHSRPSRAEIDAKSLGTGESRLGAGQGTFCE